VGELEQQNPREDSCLSSLRPTSFAHTYDSFLCLWLQFIQQEENRNIQTKRPWDGAMIVH
jgi:hypothetical protein